MEIDKEQFPPPLSAMKDELYDTQSYHHHHHSTMNMGQQHQQHYHHNEFIYPGKIEKKKNVLMN